MSGQSPPSEPPPTTGGVAGLASRIAGLSREKRAELLQRMAQLKPAAGTTAATARPLPRAEESPEGFELSFAQLRFWLNQELEPKSPLVNEAAAYRLRGELRFEAFRAALRTMVARHESLRTCFQVDSRGEPRQRIVSTAAVHLPLTAVDLSNLDAEGREGVALNLALIAARRPFDRRRAPLFRLAFLRLNRPREIQGEQLWVLAIHHLIADGSSFAILLDELWRAYGAALRGEVAHLPDLPARAVDFAAWQRRRFAAGELKPDLEYWRGRLVPPPAELALPFDRPRPPEASFAAGALMVRFDRTTTAGLTALRAQQGTTLYIALIAAFAALTSRLSGQRDICLGTTIAERSHPEVAPLVGCLINLLALRLEVTPEIGFVALLRQAREVALSAFAHSELPYDRMVEALSPPRAGFRPPYFQVVLNQRDDPMAGKAVPGLTLSPHEALQKGAIGFDLVLELGREDEGCQELFLLYARALFDHSTALRLGERLSLLLAAAVARPEAALRYLPLMTPQELEQVKAVLPRGERATTPTTVPALASASREARPEAIAALWAGDPPSFWSWAELGRRSSALARGLRSRGALPGEVVAVLAQRSPELSAAILGLWQTGCVYLPLDVALPAERLRFMVEDAGARLLLTLHREDDPEPPAQGLERLDGAKLLAGDGLTSVAAAAEAAAESWTVPPDWPAYLIFTSGSTGRPKAVVMAHRGLGSLAEQQRDWLGLGPETRLLQFSSPSFDASLWELALTVAAQGTLVSAERWRSLPGEPLAELLAEQAIGAALIPPSSLAAVPTRPLPHFRLLAVGGETCSSELADRWQAAGRKLVNLYGPTEATVLVSGEKLRPHEAPTLGRPIRGAEIYIVAAGGELAPVGATGELCLGGIGLALGYHGRCALTAERFVPHAFSSEAGARLYRSGDLGRWSPDGRLIYLGRTDQQIKLRGFRLEIGEIEATLRDHPQVVEAAVVIAHRPGGEGVLAAFYTVRDPVPEPAELSAFLRSRLPEHAVPAWLVPLSTLPTHSSGKLDRAALRLPAAPRQRTTPAAPTTELERELAGLWSELLGVAGVGLDDNFFDLGGHSLLVARLHAQLSTRPDRTLPITDLFRFPTVRQLAARLAGADRAQPSVQERGRARAEKSRAARKARLSHPMPEEAR